MSRSQCAWFVTAAVLFAANGTIALLLLSGGREHVAAARARDVAAEDERSKALSVDLTEPGIGDAWVGSAEQLQREAVLAAVSVCGTLRVPSEWRLDMPTLMLEEGNVSWPCSLMQRVQGSNGVFEWCFDGVKPATYRLSVTEVGFGIRLEVGSQPMSCVVVEVPPPAAVLVRVFDAVLEEDIDVWIFSWDAGALSPGCVAIFDPDARGYRLRAPVGPIEVSAMCSLHGHVQQWAHFQVLPGQNEFVLELAKPMGVRVVLRDGESRFAPPTVLRNWLLSLASSVGTIAEGLDGGQVLSTMGHSDETIFYVDRPGSYRVVIPDVEGYEPVAEQRVDVALEELADLVVDLVRKP